MPAERFYLNADFNVGSSVCLMGNEYHHLVHVLRLRNGEEVELANGRGFLARAKISDIEKEIATLEILSENRFPPASIQLISAIPLMRPSKLEWVIEKGTEIGAHSFLLYCADYSEKNSLSEHQIERLRHLSISALKQSGRLYLPALEVLPHLESVLSKEGDLIFGDIRDSAPLLSSLELKTSTLFITGPEKGFSKRELLLLDQKAKGFRINPHTLRAETAAIAGLSILVLETVVE